MTMFIRRSLAISLICAAIAGCGTGADEVPTDPSQLKPLTEAEKAEIKKQDDAVAAEEGQSIKFGKNAK